MSEKVLPVGAPATRPVSPPPAYSASQSQTNGPPPAQRPPKAQLPRGPFPLDLPVLNELRRKRVVLASASPRRRQLLAQIGLTNVEILPSTFPENLPKSLTHVDYVRETAMEKALESYRRALDDPARGDPAVLIAADTVVVSGATGAVLEKPRSEAQHEAMLHDLRDGGPHTVATGVAVVAPMASARTPGYVLETAVEETIVQFDRAASDDLIRAYVRTREGADKAGGYGIQGMGALLVEKIDGAYDNVVGLPLRTTMRLVEKVMAKANTDDLEDEEGEDGEDG